jgi:hypothetical protein
MGQAGTGLPASSRMRQHGRTAGARASETPLVPEAVLRALGEFGGGLGYPPLVCAGRERYHGFTFSNPHFQSSWIG